MDVFLCCILALFTITQVLAQDFFPHGLEFESHVALSPSAHNFFKSEGNPGQHQSDYVLSPLPQAAEVEAAQALRQGSRTRSITSNAADNGSGTLTSKGIAGLVLGLVATGSIAGVASYVLVTRRANLIRARPTTDP